MAKNTESQNKIAIYQTKSGSLEVIIDASHETFLLTQRQVADIFDVQKAAISKHAKNIFDSGELERRATVSIVETVQKEGKREVIRNVEYYNLDLVLSIGYRVNSSKATKFRQWATKTLRSYIVDGYAINPARVQKNYEAFLEAVAEVKALLPAGTAIDNESILELITLFSDTWLSLEAYDADKLVKGGVTKKEVKLTASALTKALANLKEELLKKGEATDLFGADRHSDSVAGIIGDVMQSFNGRPVYSTVEEKAAHLLYFIVKNHPFTDGNKRSGAYAFIWYLQKAGILNKTRITPPALTALTLLVAESESRNKERTISLILQLLRRDR
jgi:prophage maintenance system killer protein